MNMHYICNHKNLSLKNKISAFKGFTVMGSRYIDNLLSLRQLINEKGKFQLSESQIPFQLPYSILPLGIYSFASRFVNIYFVLMQLSDRLQRAVSAIQSERSAFFGVMEVAGGPPSFLLPQIFVPKETWSWCLWAFYLTPRPSKEMLQMQLSASKIFIAQIILPALSLKSEIYYIFLND